MVGTPADPRPCFQGSKLGILGEVERCLRLCGGYGYMTEYPIARLYADARVSRIYGGTSEVLKTVISHSLGL